VDVDVGAGRNVDGVGLDIDGDVGQVLGGAVLAERDGDGGLDLQLARPQRL
jgi:hypothetical protein